MLRSASLDAVGTPVHPAEDETADEVIPGHSERRRAGRVEIDVVIVLLDAAKFQVVANAESYREVPRGSPGILNISRHNTDGCSRVRGLML